MGTSSPHSVNFQPRTRPSLGDTALVTAPAFSRALRGSSSSICSKPSVTRIATLSRGQAGAALAGERAAHLPGSGQMQSPVPPRNRLLGSLSASAWGRVLPHLQEVPLPQGRALFEFEDRIDRLYFPTAGVISTVAVFEGGATAEMATTGCEGMIAVDVVLGGDTALARFLVQVPGSALTIGIEPFRRLQADVPGFAEMLLVYAQAYLAQLQQSVACNGVHSLEERAARWLLMMRDRSDGSFPLTQEILAQMLGASRTAVNLTARSLQRAGLISYRRGIIRILDHGGLEDLSCECYQIVRRDFERRFGPRLEGRVPPLG